MISPNLAVLKSLFIFAFAPNQKKKAESELDFLLGQEKKKNLKFARRGGQRKNKRKT
jgi:hypothetical protein